MLISHHPGTCLLIFLSLFFSEPNQELESIWVPIQDEKCPGGYRLQEQEMLFPHRLVTYLFNEAELEIPTATLHKFWDDCLETGEPFASPECRDRIPIGIYGDSAQLITAYRVEKITCIFMNFILFRPRAVRYSRFLLWACDSSILYRNRTTNTILRWIAWSFNWMYEGLNPTNRPGGRPLSKTEDDRAGQPLTKQGHRFQLVEIRGDWEWHKAIWNFSCSWKGGVNMGLCYRCPCMARAADPGLLYFNHDENSSWAVREFDTNEYIADRLPTSHVCALAPLHYSYFWIPMSDRSMQI